jgi:hypothetical protein
MMVADPPTRPPAPTQFSTPGGTTAGWLGRSTVLWLGRRDRPLAQPARRAMGLSDLNIGYSRSFQKTLPLGPPAGSVASRRAVG